MSDHPPSSREALSPVAPSPPSAAATSPPAKRTRKATKRRCEFELMRDDYIEETDDIDELHMSSISRTCSEEALESSSLSSTVKYDMPAKMTPMMTTSTPTTPSPPGQAALQPVPSPLSSPTPLPSASPAGPPNPVATARTLPTAPATPELPAPHPWPEGYVFSNDPDHIIWHYNYIKGTITTSGIATAICVTRTRARPDILICMYVMHVCACVNLV
jgi:hypothetical protein